MTVLIIMGDALRRGVVTAYVCTLCARRQLRALPAFSVPFVCMSSMSLKEVRISYQARRSPGKKEAEPEFENKYVWPRDCIFDHYRHNLVIAPPPTPSLTRLSPFSNTQFLQKLHLLLFFFFLKDFFFPFKKFSFLLSKIVCSGFVSIMLAEF